MVEMFGEKVNWYLTGECVVMWLERLDDDEIMSAKVLMVQAVVIGLMAIAEQVAELRRVMAEREG